MLRTLALSAILVAATSTSAWASMPPKKYDAPYAGPVRVRMVAVRYTDDSAAFRECNRISMQHYGEPYGTEDGFPKYGCSMYDAARNWAVMVYTYDTPKIAKRRLATTDSVQEFDRCMGFNSATHEWGHMKQAAMGEEMNHSGWSHVASKCRYDASPVPPVPSS